MEKLTIIGAGSMTEALISGMVENKLLNPKGIWATNRSNKEKLQKLEEHYHISTSYDLDELLEGTDAVLLAMKPKDALEGISKIQPYLKKDMLIISVLAGVSITSIERLIEPSMAIVRAMPNTSATIGKSATALAFNDHVSEKQKALAENIFQTVGMTTIVNEEQLDAITGLSGSGPAYIYYIVEAMEQSAVDLGLERKVAKDLIVQTISGAAEMLARSTKEPGQLRREVTSPGGTTEAGLSILQANNVNQAFIDCIKEATAQSKRMGKMISSEMENQVL